MSNVGSNINEINIEKIKIKIWNSLKIVNDRVNALTQFVALSV